MNSDGAKPGEAGLEIQLIGPLRMRSLGGADCTPAGKRSRAILAMLALAPDGQCSRAWVQDRLWGTRGKEQAAASLRQSLAEIRRALGVHRGCLSSDSHLLALDRSRIRTDLDRWDERDASARPNAEILAGLDVGDRAFEQWLAEQRQSIAARQRSRSASQDGPLRDGRPANVLLLEKCHDGGDPAGAVLAEGLADSIAKTVSELGAADVLDRRAGTQAGHLPEASTLSLSSSAARLGGDHFIRLTMTRAPVEALVWSSTVRDPAGTGDGQSQDALRLINQAVHVAIDQFAQDPRAPTQPMAAELCRRGIAHLFRLGRDNIEIADRLFAQAYEMVPRGIFLAWRGYLRTFVLAERQFTCRKTLDDETMDFARRALIAEPHNSYVAALSAHVHAMMKRSYVASYELSERSILLNGANPIGWACLGIAKCYLGRPEEGFYDTVRAREISGSAPFRFQLDGLSCIAGTMAGQFEKAIHLGESSHALAPNFAPPLRYLAALYLQTRRPELSFERVEALRSFEPDFEYEKLRDKAYPAAGLHRTGILDLIPQREL